MQKIITIYCQAFSANNVLYNCTSLYTVWSLLESNKIGNVLIRLESKDLLKMAIIPRTLKNKIFIQDIGIAEKSQETRRDRCGGNAVNHKSLF